MRRLISSLMLNIVAIVVFSGIGVCADNIQPKDNLKKVKTPTKAEMPIIAKAESIAPKAVESKIESPKIESSQVAETNIRPENKEMTREEMLVNLKKDVADNEDVLNMVPGLRASAGQNGDVVYTYKGTALDKLSKEDLGSLYINVRQNLVRVRTERTEKQLETVRRVERLQRVGTPPQSPRAPYVPPPAPRTISVPVTPQAPRGPYVPPSVPRAPSAPSTPPSPPATSQRR